MGKAFLSAAPAWVEDIETDPGYSEEFRAGARARGMRSAVSVPMLREGEAIGVISVNRSIPGRFSDHQTNLLQTFADQAVIAIENCGCSTRRRRRSSGRRRPQTSCVSQRIANRRAAGLDVTPRRPRLCGGTHGACSPTMDRFHLNSSMRSIRKPENLRARSRCRRAGRARPPARSYIGRSSRSRMCLRIPSTCCHLRLAAAAFEA